MADATMGTDTRGRVPPRPPTGHRGTEAAAILLLRLLISSLVGPVSTTVTSVGLGCGRRLGNELHAVALVDTCLTVGTDLTPVVVVDARTCLHAVVGGVVCARKFAVELKSGSLEWSHLYLDLGAVRTVLPAGR